MRLPLSCALTLAATAFAAEPAPRFEELLKIDVHSHVFEDHPDFPALFRRLNFRTINVCNNGTDGHLERMHAIAFALHERHRNAQRLYRLDAGAAPN